MRSRPPLHSSSMLLWSLPALSFFSCLISTAMAASIPPTEAMNTTATHLNVRAPPATAAGPSGGPSLNEPGIPLLLVLHLPPRPHDIRSSTDGAYMSIQSHALARDRSVVPTNLEAIVDDPYRSEVGNILFRGATTPDFPKAILEIETHAREVQSQREKVEDTLYEHLIHIDRLGKELDFLDAIMNWLISGDYEGWIVPEKVLEAYKKNVADYRAKIKPGMESQYLDIVLNAHPASNGKILSANVDMNFGNHFISKSFGYSYAHPSRAGSDIIFAQSDL